MQVYLLRHGIAEELKPGAPDSARALVPEGRRKLKEVLRVARSAEVQPSLILTSPFRRAMETAEIAMSAFGLNKSDLVQVQELVPTGDPAQVWAEIRLYKEEEQLLLVGHEPLFSQLTAYLLGAPALMVDFKKGALARIDIEAFGPQPRGILRWMLPPKLATD